MKKNIAVVIAHYDVDGEVALDLINLIVALGKRAKSITFVSTNISKKSAKKVASLCDLVIRENVGFDFSSYKVGIEKITDKNSLDSILIINSSVIYFDVENLLDSYFNKSPNEPSLFGLSQSVENGHHVQSFWVEFCSNTLINSLAFEYWWSNVQELSSQNEVIHKYEIGMSKYFKDIGVDVSALYERLYEDKLLAACRSISDDHFNLIGEYNFSNDNGFTLPIDLADNINPTSILWDVILMKYHWIKVKSFERTNRDFRKYKFIKYIERNIDNLEQILSVLESRGVEIELRDKKSLQ